jgi:hypothetical protein
MKAAYKQADFLLRNCSSKQQALEHAQWALNNADNSLVILHWKLVIGSIYEINI